MYVSSPSLNVDARKLIYMYCTQHCVYWVDVKLASSNSILLQKLQHLERLVMLTHKIALSEMISNNVGDMEGN